MQLPPPSHLTFAVHEHFLVLEQIASISSRTNQVSQLQQLSEPDRVASYGDFAPLRHSESVAVRPG
jgi:hypothetical protein